MFEPPTPCTHCKGYGSIAIDGCSNCNTTGTVVAIRNITLKIPPGVTTNHIVRFDGEGHPGHRNSKRSGNLIIAFQIADHKIFSVDGPHLHVKVPLSLSQAVLGGSITIPWLNGDVDAQIRPGIQHGEKIVLYGKGVNPTGNLYVHCDIIIPSSSTLTKKQTDIIYTLDNRTNPGTRSQLYTMLLRTIDFFYQKIRRFQTTNNK